MISLTGFTFNKIVIIQSLEPDEVETGKFLSEHIAALLADSECQSMPVQLILCSHAYDFLTVLNTLTQEAKTGQIPLLHIECHGCPVDGLEFENSSTLSWEDVSKALLHLNIACRFNLLAVFAACFGAYFLEQIRAVQPAPCWCLVAPTEKVDVAEIIGGFRVFYTALLTENDMGSAIRAISNCRLSQGYWLSKPAELWFESIVTGYIKEHCNYPAARERAKKIFRARKLTCKKHRGMGALLRILHRLNRTTLLDRYFDTYFITEQLPENKSRFEGTYKRVDAKLAELRDSGKYLI